MGRCSSPNLSPPNLGGWDPHTGARKPPNITTACLFWCPTKMGTKEGGLGFHKKTGASKKTQVPASPILLIPLLGPKLKVEPGYTG